MSEPFRIFVGWDSREPEAYDVCAHSIARHASIPVAITPIKQEELRERGLYWRERDPLASTQFTYTRFLTPLLAGYRGHALFCDCDFLWTADIAQLVALIDPAKAVSCVQHDHRPPEDTKMDGAVQTRYPRKNWSSLMLFNCAHPSVRKLDAETVNTESGAYLHRMQWAADDEIGALPETWNWLEGWCARPPQGVPSVIHYTRGGPWFEQWQTVDYADLWRDEFARVQAGR
jgi:lipopolysaccharide biosynthesis glycosyltransferase